jgi:hypothetical protein
MYLIKKIVKLFSQAKLPRLSSGEPEIAGPNDANTSGNVQCA